MLASGSQKRVSSTFLCMIMIIGAVGIFATQPVQAHCPNPSYGTAVVGGDYSEWSLTDDFFANMYEGWNQNGKDRVTATLYLRYDCSQQVLYVLVLAKEPSGPTYGPIATGAKGGDNWVALDGIDSKTVNQGSGNDGVPPDFAWIGLSGDGNFADGWEASFSMSPGSHHIWVHASVWYSGAANTSGTETQKHGHDLCVSCPPVSGMKFDDKDGDGVKDAGELGLSGWTIRLYKWTRHYPDWVWHWDYVTYTTTSGSGTYSFDIYSEATYKVCEVLQSGYTQTYPKSDTPGSTSCDVEGTRGWTFSYSGSTIWARNFGNFKEKASPSIVTVASSPITLGGSASDTATLSNGNSPTGSITFKAYGPSDTAGCTGTPAFGPNVVTVDHGNGDYKSGSFTPSAAGKYWWIASYGGDGNNNAVSTSCGDSGETLVVNKVTPNIETELSATSISIGDKVSDSATLKGVTSGAGGDVTYNVYDGDSCGGDALGSDKVAVTDGVVLDSKLFDVFDSAGKYSFQAVYSGDPNNDGATSDCKTEILTVLENGHIVVDKVTAPTGDTTSFSFITTGSGYNGFSLTDTDIPNNQELKPGVEYSVQESPVPSGWTLAGLDCSSATKTSTISTDLLTGKATITLAAGDIVTCTFTDEKSAGQTATLTVTKHVISDHGGMAEAKDFMIHVMYYDATNAVWLEVTTSPQPGDESGTLYSGLNPGIYKVTEDEPPPLYVQVSITGDCAADGTVTVEANTNKECTITNKDPALVVIKHVIGGSKSASDFIITVNAEYAIPATFPGSESGTRVVLNPGLYSVTEIPIAGYSTTYSADCSGTILVDEPTKTCVITNEYSAGQGQTIMVVKNTIGGEGTFAFTVTGPSPSAPSITTSGGTGTTGLIPVAAGTYSISETVPTGWRLTGGSCSSGTPESFTVPEGGTVTCTFTNEQLKAPVGGEVYSIDKLALLSPYLTLLGLLGAVGIAFAVRRGRDV